MMKALNLTESLCVCVTLPSVSLSAIPSLTV